MDAPGPTGECLKLARRRLESLREQLSRHRAQQLALALDRMREARQIARTDPERAQAVYHAVIELYGDKPWATQAVNQARAALGKE